MLWIELDVPLQWRGLIVVEIHLEKRKKEITREFITALRLDKEPEDPLMIFDFVQLQWRYGAFQIAADGGCRWP